MHSATERSYPATPAPTRWAAAAWLPAASSGSVTGAAVTGTKTQPQSRGAGHRRRAAPGRHRGLRALPVGPADRLHWTPPVVGLPGC